MMQEFENTDDIDGVLIEIEDIVWWYTFLRRRTTGRNIPLEIVQAHVNRRCVMRDASLT